LRASDDLTEIIQHQISLCTQHRLKHVIHETAFMLYKSHGTKHSLKHVIHETAFTLYKSHGTEDGVKNNLEKRTQQDVRYKSEENN